MHSTMHSTMELFGLSMRDGDDDDSCQGGCLTKWRIIFGAILVVEGLAFAHLIYGLKGLKRFSNVGSGTLQKVKHYGNALSAGIFLSTGMIHLLPEVIELFDGGHGEEEEEEAAERTGEDGEEENITYPWAYFSVVAAFYAMIGLERILIPRLVGTTACNLEESSAAHEHAENYKIEEEGASDNMLVGEAEKGEDVEAKDGVRSPVFVRGIIRVGALSVHSLVESMALGLSGSFSTTLNIFVALAAHRWATAISIAFHLAWTLDYIPFLLLVLLFTLTAPVGIALGAALTSLNNTVQGVFFAISTSTFIYLGAFAAVSEEFVEHPVWLVRKFFVMVGGAAIISLVTWVLVAKDIHG